MQKLFIFCLLLLPFFGFSQKKLEVFFDFNKDVPNSDSQIKIDKWLTENKNAEIVKLAGYCDSVDNSEYNKDLAMRRINSMLSLFKNNKISIAEKIELKPFGKDFNYSKIQSDNRKVEVFYTIPKEQEVIHNEKQTLPNKPDEVKKEDGTAKTYKENDFESENREALVLEEKATLAAKFKKAREGDIIRINNINFYFNSEKVMEQSIPLLNELLKIMLDNPKLRIEIHGHICCNPNPNDTKLSYRRALAVLKYLTGHSIEIGRLAFKGFGSSDPIYKVPERNEKERIANRRVEILIVSKK